ncbi:MAG TPA: hypothetical protein DEG71_01210 [Clostridiales bacterium]|nr:hypothetical protein [Clostridiales bacterium]
MNELTRQENESIKSYKLRLCRNKDLYNLNSKSIAELINKETENNFNESTYRKWFSAYEEGYTDARKEGISDEDVLKEINVKQTSLQKEKYKIQSLRLDMNRIIRESSRTELLVEEFINAIKEMSPLPYPEFKPLQNQKVDKQYVLSFADAHYGKQFESITNTYDLDIVYERFNKLLTETIDIIEECKISKLTILALGDLIEGMCLRISQLSNIKIGITQQTVKFMRFIVSWLNKLGEYVEIDYYQTPYSNHTQIRPFGTKANEFADEDMEQIIFAYIHDMLDSNPRIRVNECLTKYLIFKIFNYNIIAGHGHDIKNTTDFIKDASSKYKIFFDYAFFAHKHSSGNKAVGEGDSNNCEIINIPSIMGSDEYADDLFVGSKAGATLIEFTEKQGKRKTYDIILN